MTQRKEAPAIGRGKLALIAVAMGLLLTTAIVAIQTRGHEAGMDFWFYRDIGIRWLADGTYYLPHQVTGEPYALVPMVDVLYPPTALVLFVPFAFLPAILWWVIPLGVVAYVVWSYRPSPWGWVAIAACVAWPRTFGAVLFGNTDMWVAAAIAGGLRWGWPAALLAIKPPFIPFGLVAVRKRSAWVAAAILGVLSLPLLGQYWTSLVNLRVDGFAYAAVSIPFALVPIIAWATRAGAPAGWSWSRLGRRTAAGPALPPSGP
jgi:hypothetical protein